MQNHAVKFDVQATLGILRSECCLQVSESESPAPAAAEEGETVPVDGE